MDEVVFRHPRLGRAQLKALAARSDAKGLRQLALHAALLVITGVMLGSAIGSVCIVPAMVLHGVALVFLFAPLHECIHRTAFRSTRLNDVVATRNGPVILTLPDERA